MSLHLRRSLAVCAVSAIAFGGAVLPTASAADVSCADPAALATAVTDAQTAVTQAKAAFKATNVPLGKAVAAKRAEARAELKQSRSQMRTLVKEARHTKSGSELTDLRAQMKVERHDIAESRNLLTYKKALLASIKTDRTTARDAFRAARTALETLKTLQESCSGTTDTTDGTTDTGTTDTTLDA